MRQAFRRYIHGLAWLLLASSALAQGRVGVSAGIGTAYAVDLNGALYAWGGNDQGQLGTGKLYQKSEPGLIPRLPALTSLTQGQYHSLALSQDGAVYAWGWNTWGHLGLGDRLLRVAPVKVPLETRASGVAAGGLHSLALGVDGRVWGWGGNPYGEVGQVPTQVTMTLRPALVPGLTGVQAVAAGALHSLALDGDGKVWSWGWNALGQLGRVTSAAEPSHTPQRVPGLTAITALVAAEFASFGLDQQGQLWAWGYNGNGQLGIDPALDSAKPVVLQTLPVRVPGLPALQAVAAGQDHTLALDRQGTVWSWGANFRGALGRGAVDGTPQPVAQPVSLPQPVRQIAAGYRVSYAVDVTGTVWAWGSAEAEQLGTAVPDQPTPVIVGQLPPMQQVAAGRHRLASLAADGTVWSWGTNPNGQPGSENLPLENTPLQVSTLPALAQVAGGGMHALALGRDGTVWAWGSNRNGNLARPDLLQQSTVPLRVEGLPAMATVYASAVNSYALDAKGQVYAWGDNSEGQLGLGPTVPSRDVPTPWPGGPALTALAAGARHALGIDEKGSLWVWGGNTDGQLGTEHGRCIDGRTDLRCAASPVQVATPAAPLRLAAGDLHSLVLLADGTLLASGANGDGQLGLDLSGDSRVLLPVPIPARLVELAAGGRFSLALDDTGSVWSWGVNDQGQLGHGATGPGQSSPTRIAGLPSIVAIAAGWESGYALAKDGTLWAWGRNDEGALGDGTHLQRARPGPVLDGQFQGLLNLRTGVAAPISGTVSEPFLVKVKRKGDVNWYSLELDVFGRLDVAAATQGRNTVARYLLYVAALSERGNLTGWLQLDPTRQWQPLSWPIQQFMQDVALGTGRDQIWLQLLEKMDTTAMPGARIYIGYGLNADEMLIANRFRQVDALPVP